MLDYRYFLHSWTRPHADHLGSPLLNFTDRQNDTQVDHFTQVKPCKVLTYLSGLLGNSQFAMHQNYHLAIQNPIMNRQKT